MIGVEAVGYVETSAELAAGVATGLAAVAVGGTLTWAALSAGSQMFGRTLVAPKRPDEICLTYDDGPNPAVTPLLLEALARAEVRATFFLIGGFVRQCPEMVREIRAAGHLVGNHTMTHPWLAWQTERRIREEIAGASAAIEDVLGERVRYFRAPHGARRPVVLRVVREMGMVPVQWNAMGYDWRPVGAAEIAGSVEKGVARNRRAGLGSNILLHDGGHTGLGAARMETVRATQMLVERCAGARFVGVDAWG
ncbi:polysaccharide deacetylase family protein [Edaphobacter aggregans]|uniref:polysaccharide deacetylase family protein n=1 Tax=Edaphobacter aggregans TaxID=570835 RepID=UPI00068A84CF|nr:polysaccharide deacetylase family protein [Edaphobacter aggregans]